MWPTASPVTGATSAPSASGTRTWICLAPTHRPLRPELADKVQEPHKAPALRRAGLQDHPLHRHRGLRDRGPGENSVLSSSSSVGKGARTSSTVSFMPGRRRRGRGRGQYAIIGENTIVHAGEGRHGADGSGDGTSPPAARASDRRGSGHKGGAMIYDSVAPGEGGAEQMIDLHGPIPRRPPRLNELRELPLAARRLLPSRGGTGS